MPITANSLTLANALHKLHWSAENEEFSAHLSPRECAALLSVIGHEQPTVVAPDSDWWDKPE
jgi:hypothetical protein